MICDLTWNTWHSFERLPWLLSHFTPYFCWWFYVFLWMLFTKICGLKLLLCDLMHCHWVESEYLLFISCFQYGLHGNGYVITTLSWSYIVVTISIYTLMNVWCEIRFWINVSFFMSCPFMCPFKNDWDIFLFEMT